MNGKDSKLSCKHFRLKPCKTGTKYTLEDNLKGVVAFLEDAVSMVG